MAEHPPPGPGDVSDLEALLAAEYPRAYRTACLVLRNPADAEEAVQEAFLRIWRFRDAVPAGSGQRAWVYRVVVNAATSKLRSDRGWNQRLGPEASAVALEQVVAATEGPELAAEDSQARQLVHAALEALPEHLRVVVVLRYYAGLSEREIATAIARRPGTVKSRLHEARRQLSQQHALQAWMDTQPAGRAGPATSPTPHPVHSHTDETEVAR